jgi:hypothetical protein
MQGFVRDASGNFTVFNPPGSVATQPMSINAQGFIAGNYYDGTLTHGFVRAPDGTFTTITFSVVPGYPWNTTISAINGEGVVAGSTYFGSNNPGGYILPPGGTFTGVGSVAFDINEVGAATGVTFTTQDHALGWVYLPDGTGTALILGPYTFPFGINRRGVVAGFWLSGGGRYSGFLRATDGTITSFPYPGAAPFVQPPFFTRATSGVQGGINVDSTVTGTYLDNNGSHGFVRTASDGVITTFDLGPGDTTAVAINDSGVITGSYRQNSERTIGYLRIP